MSNGTVTYPYWDSFNRYCVAGVTGAETVFAQLYLHPSGYYQARCYGSHPTCPHKLGPYFSLASAQSNIQIHCQDIHYILPPGAGPPLAPMPPEILGISPDFGPKNNAFTLTVSGQNFTSTSVIYFDGTAETTTFTNSGQLSCAIAGNQMPTDRSYAVAVVDPVNGTSNTLYFTATT